MKKSVRLTLGTAAVTLFLAGCGVESGNNGGNDNTAADNNANEAADNDGGEENEEGETYEAGDGEAEHEFQIGWNSGLEDDSKGVAAQAFIEYVAEESDGAIAFELFPNETYATSPEMIEAVQVGALDMALPGANELASVVPEYAALSLPFLTEGPEEAHAVLDSDVGDHLLELSEGTGFYSLSDVELGFAQITNDVRPIEEPEDVEGLTIRSPDDASLIETFNTLGASVSTMAYTELYSGLSQGVIDGQFNPLPSIYDQNMQEVQDYLSVTNHSYYYSYFIIHDDLFDELDEDLQEIIRQGADEARHAAREFIADEEEAALERAEDEFEVVSYPELEPFQEAVQPVYEEMEDVMGEDIINRMQEFLEDYRSE
ncbi:TRAP transporter substrate-binding protein [Alkalicoccus saliphilus]|uniref:C4-dicarboxylate ABC transporter substrate-binding protein n=1 Tax=Alkalicoccus saliphilus TaxID=200989 RepID=A0A2T4U461_9BACI|nr:TRAP transporter substrate-binding protein [Alkalicoccus saliphilus]PTL38188.1 C4-dicarboxylate ABC transporter substrate-binding protein [Alkalicoccus saliphilus]